MTGVKDMIDLLALIEKEEELREKQRKAGREYSTVFGYAADANRDVGV